MLSRVADSIYWMSRYMERAENTARFLDVIRHLVLDLPQVIESQWSALVSVTGDSAAFEDQYGTTTEEHVIRFLTFDRNNPNSLLSCLLAARENARSIREVISSEMWEQVNRSYLMLRDAEETGRIEEEPAAFFAHFKKACQLYLGIADTTWTHGEGWQFGRLGRLLERADKTSRIVDVKYFMLLPRPDYVGSPYDSLQWAALLKCVSAFEMFMKRFRRITPSRVVEFLVLDREFPRSMRYCLIRAEEALHGITGTPAGTFGVPAEQRLGRLRAELDYASVDDIITDGLHEFLDGFQAELNAVGDAVFDSFFAVRPTAAADRGRESE